MNKIIEQPTKSELNNQARYRLKHMLAYDADFEKVLRIGKVPTTTLTCRPIMDDLFIKIEVKDKQLSISGVIGPMKSGNARGGCGQIDMEFAHRNPKDDDKRYSDPITHSQIEFAKGWTVEMWWDLLDAWKEWHLNDLQSACEHQRAKGLTYDKAPLDKCKKCGWKLGNGWRTKPVPVAVIEFLRELPDTDKKPAWV